MNIVKYTAEEAEKLVGDSNDVRLTDEAPETAVENDPDNPLLTQEQLDEFKPSVQRENGVYAHKKSK